MQIPGACPDLLPDSFTYGAGRGCNQKACVSANQVTLRPTTCAIHCAPGLSWACPDWREMEVNIKVKGRTNNNREGSRTPGGKCMFINSSSCHHSLRGLRHTHQFQLKPFLVKQMAQKWVLKNNNIRIRRGVQRRGNEDKGCKSGMEYRKQVLASAAGTTALFQLLGWQRHQPLSHLLLPTGQFYPQGLNRPCMSLRLGQVHPNFQQLLFSWKKHWNPL